MIILFLGHGCSNSFSNIDLVNPSLGTLDIQYSNSTNNESILLKYPCLNNHYCTAYNITLNPGLYLFQVWGAQGGNQVHNGFFGGKGGFSISLFQTDVITNLYVFIGGRGSDSIYTNNQLSAGGFNGGGNGGYTSYSTTAQGCGGGGATDIRFNINDVLSRFIVAGGGGGSGSFKNGGVGGGIHGESGQSYNVYGAGGVGGDNSLVIIDGFGMGATPGLFGFGGNGSFGGWNTYSIGCGGGGGGYYGGSGGIMSSYSSTNGGGGGGGGSGYVNQNSFSIQYGIISGTLPGNVPFLSPNYQYEIGHEDHGAARITKLSTHSSEFTYNPNPLLTPFSFYYFFFTLFAFLPL